MPANDDRIEAIVMDAKTSVRRAQLQLLDLPQVEAFVAVLVRSAVQAGLDVGREERERLEAECKAYRDGQSRVAEAAHQIIDDNTVRAVAYERRIAALEQERDALYGLIREVRPFVDTDATAVVEELAARFYRDTGWMAPGKSVAPEMANSQPDNIRDIYYQWVRTHRGVFLAAIDAALASNRSEGET